MYPAALSILISLSGILATFVHAGESPPLQVGYAQVDITPEVTDERPVWLAGYGHGRQATGVHDPLYARCFVLASGADAGHKIALVSVDVVGLQYPLVQYIRERLPDIDFALVSSTHNHEAPDVIGIWGETPFQRGVDSDWLRGVADKLVDTVRSATDRLQPATAEFGTADDDNLLRDSRLPKAYDGVLRLLKFQSVPAADVQPRNLGVLMVWSSHPEALGSKNTLITADFPYATVAALEKKYECPAAFFIGACGGLMAPPGGRFRDADGNSLHSGQFEFAEAYGHMVADLASKAVAKAKPISLTPFTVAAKPIAIPLENRLYSAARLMGVIRRPGRLWTGDPETLGEQVNQGHAAGENLGAQLAVETEVSYLKLGELHLAGIPGEIYPELVYGKFQEPADPGADFPDAPLEKTVAEIIPSEQWMLIGLANDEIGYIIPKRQWDQKAPFAYGRKTSQYGEINSCGSEVGPIIMRALELRAQEALAQQP